MPRPPLLPRLALCAILALSPGTALAAAESTPGGALFERPSQGERLRAIGNRFEEPEAGRELFVPDADFPPITIPRRGDWLAEHEETGQTFEDYNGSEPPRADGARRIIYLLPLGEFSADEAPPLEELRAYAAAFFQLEVRVLPRHIPGAKEFTPRRNRATQRRQLLSTGILAYLRGRVPPDAHCLLAVTMEDLYPAPSWNYVFGQASLNERVGVYSFARHDPAFFGEPRGAAWRERALRRTCKILAHETAHMFGLAHCIYYDCVVNGANHLDEADAHPQHACPVCLRKLRHGAGFDPVRRYEALHRFYRRLRWFEEADWVARQLARVRREMPSDGR